ncbi:unnamed protein product [Hymenolepis diminuta]|uniref:Uncharacterized protein n=1 Tax=Hymenolepis diminuta TaxID=6216 RepID=A0A564Y713_HYMDI|nr:unnamed protein product [Hymenolepis diminuta]
MKEWKYPKHLPVIATRGAQTPIADQTSLTFVSSILTYSINQFFRHSPGAHKLRARGPYFGGCVPEGII